MKSYYRFVSHTGLSLLSPPSILHCYQTNFLDALRYAPFLYFSTITIPPLLYYSHLSSSMIHTWSLRHPSLNPYFPFLISIFTLLKELNQTFQYLLFSTHLPPLIYVSVQVNPCYLSIIWTLASKNFSLLL